MTDHDDDRHAQHVETICRAVAGLPQRFAKDGIGYEQAIEGAQKGAAVLAVMAGLSLAETAQIFRDFADALEPAEGEADPTKPTMQ